MSPAAGVVRGCGLVAVRVDAKAYSYWSMNRVHASGVACAAARGLVRDWAVALAAGRIPARVLFGTVNAHGVIVWGGFGPPYRFEGYTCRWANTKPGPHDIDQPGAGRCRSGGAVVSWSFHAALNPTLGQVRGCPETVAVGPVSATTITAHAITCTRAKRVIRYLLTHRLVRPPRIEGFASCAHACSGSDSRTRDSSSARGAARVGSRSRCIGLPAAAEARR
jgi:hypothetical protein